MSTLKEKLRTLFTEETVEYDDVPSGWRTVEEWAEECNLSQSHVRNRLHKLAELGKAQTKQFRIPKNKGRYPIIHYWIDSISGKEK